MNILVFLAVFVVLYCVLVGTVFRKEVKAVLERDPAAASFIEVVLTYPGLHAMVIYRLTHVLWTMKIPFFPRFFSQIARLFTGIEIHPGAKIGDGFFVDHGMCVVIGETAEVGDNVTLFQGVTLGGTGKEKGKRHPTIGSSVVIGAGAKVLGNITVGDNVNIGANAVVLRNVPDNSTVVGVPGRIAKKEGKRIPAGINLDHTSLPDPLQQALENLQREIDHIEEEIRDHRNGS